MNNDVGSYDMMMYRYLLLMLFMVLHCVARGQTEYVYRYWMDNASTVTFSDSSANKNWAVELDVSNLSEGVHTLHLQVRDTTGLWSNPRSNSFFKYTPVDTNNVKMRYWFDNGNEIKETQVSNGTHSLDISTLPWGIHSLLVKVENSQGVYLPAYHALFLRTRHQSEQLLARCYIGDSFYAEKQVASGGETIFWDLDVSTLPRGLHQIRTQVHGLEE